MDLMYYTLFNLMTKLILSCLLCYQQVINEDGTEEEVYICKEKRRRIVTWDETDHPYSQETDKSGSRAKSYTDPNLPRPGGSTTRGSRHTTGVYATTAAYEVLPPLFIFDTDAEKVDNYKVKCSWGEGLPVISGKFGLEDELEFPSFISVTKNGSMNDSLFCEYILDCILCLYPNITQEWVFDEKGGIISGPVLIKTDAGPGRLCANFANVEFRQKLERIGCHIILSLPNATSVSAEMDDLYREYKGCCRQKTQEVFQKKVFDRMMKIRENAYIVDPKKKHVVKPVSLNPSDLSRMINGEEGDNIKDRPFTKTFNLDSIKKSWDNIGFVPFTRKCLENKKVRHEVDETVSNKNSNNVEELQQKYNAIKERLKEEGFNNECFDIIVPKAFKMKRLKEKKDRIKLLIEKGATFSTSGLFIHTGNMVITADELTSAQKQHLDSVEQKKSDILDKKTAAMLEVKINAESGAKKS